MDSPFPPRYRSETCLDLTLKKQCFLKQVSGIKKSFSILKNIFKQRSSALSSFLAFLLVCTCYSNRQSRKHIFPENEPATAHFTPLINSIKKSNKNRQVESSDCEAVSNDAVCIELTLINLHLLVMNTWHITDLHKTLKLKMNLVCCLQLGQQQLPKYLLVPQGLGPI